MTLATTIDWQIALLASPLLVGLMLTGYLLWSNRSKKRRNKKGQ